MNPGLLAAANRERMAEIVRARAISGHPAGGSLARPGSLPRIVRNHTGWFLVQVGLRLVLPRSSAVRGAR